LAVQDASNWFESNVGKMTNLSMACAEQGEIPKLAMRLDVFVTTMKNLQKFLRMRRRRPRKLGKAKKKGA
jgi:glutaredoxin-related protein